LVDATGDRRCFLLSALLMFVLLGSGATAADLDGCRSTLPATAGAGAGGNDREQQQLYAHVAIQNAHGDATSASPAIGSHCGTSAGGSVR
jgi:hypothetical protein